MPAKTDTKTFDASKVEDEKFYDVQLARSTTLFGDPLPAGRKARLSGSAVKTIAADVLTADEVEEAAPHDIMRKEPSQGPVSTN